MWIAHVGGKFRHGLLEKSLKIASEPRFLLRRKRVKTVLAAEFLAIPSSAVKIASERRCAILVHSAKHPKKGPKIGREQVGMRRKWGFKRWGLNRAETKG